VRLNSVGNKGCVGGKGGVSEKSRVDRSNRVCRLRRLVSDLGVVAATAHKRREPSKERGNLRRAISPPGPGA